MKALNTLNLKINISTTSNNSSNKHSKESSVIVIFSAIRDEVSEVVLSV